MRRASALRWAQHGGWLAMLLLQELRRSQPKAAGRIAGLVLIAPAADMTADLMWDAFSPKARDAIRDTGVWMKPSSYGEPYPITAELIEDGAAHLMLEKGLAASCPVRILQGEADPDVPPAHALKVFEAIAAPDISLTLIARRSPAVDAGQSDAHPRDRIAAGRTRRRNHGVKSLRSARSPAR
jgi:pimeloyl-ACP methyl ester carboxylesterase